MRTRPRADADTLAPTGLWVWRQLRNHLQEFLKADRLIEHAIHSVPPRLLVGLTFSPAGEKDHGAGGVSRFDGSGDVPSIHVGHPQISQHQVDLVRHEAR